ncbi:putative integral membrane protein (TIGR00698 family) [Mycetocola sp. BIGb0189]|nr:putative sulfate exporter family transporter [Mycetocola sp. BIGb0189]MCS4275767.1 putative integral membrane protein (TIGR00698 family) [Mycetocola sp. BIGb0189]
MSTSTPPMTRIRTVLPGLGIALIAAVAAQGIHLLTPAIPALTWAVLLGILAANIPATARILRGFAAPGIAFAAKKLMRLGIVLLGLKLSLVDVAGLGWPTLLVVIGIVLITFMGTLYGGKLLRLPGDQPLLMAAGFAICGASAIGAMSAATGAKNKDAVAPVAMVTLCGTLAIAVLPLAGHLLGLGPAEFGFWVGASVHDVGQVVATAQTAGAGALAIAVVVKLTRVVLLAPMVTGTALVVRARERRNSASQETPVSATLPPILPLFVAGFLLMIVLRSFDLVAPGVLDVAAQAQDWLLALALFSLGAGVRVGELRRGGARTALLALASWVLIALLALVAVWVLRPGA